MLTTNLVKCFYLKPSVNTMLTTNLVKCFYLIKIDPNTELNRNSLRYLN